MKLGCSLSSLRGFLLFCFSLLAFQAKARSCADYLFIDNEFRELVKIASINKARRDEIMRSSSDDRKLLVHTHLLEAIRYEEKKARIYIAMLDKLLQQKNTYRRTPFEIRRRLLRSFSYYQHLSDSLTKVEGFEPRPIDAPMSERVEFFLESDEI
jgi:hypothetical protein